MPTRIKLPSIGAFNAGSGSLFSAFPRPRCGNISQVEYELLTNWETVNNFSRTQSKRLIRKNILLAVKAQGRWWVSINPNFDGSLNDI